MDVVLILMIGVVGDNTLQLIDEAEMTEVRMLLIE